MPPHATADLSRLENAVMRVVWSQQQATAEHVRAALSRSQPIKDSTVRTILRRLEKKGYVSHRLAGRTFVYSPRIESRNAATAAVRRIIERFCQGSVEDLLLGMVDDEIISPQKLRQLAARIDRADAAEKPKRPSKRGKLP
jgi:BlaI family penicillinase repressor